MGYLALPVLVLVGCSTFEGRPEADKPIIFTKDLAADIWVGVTRGTIYTYRLSLDRNGTGKLGVYYNSHTLTNLSLYSIPSWELVPNGKINISLVPITADAEIASVEGKYPSSTMTLNVRGESGWSHIVTLYREKELAENILLLRKTMLISAEDPLP